MSIPARRCFSCFENTRDRHIPKKSETATSRLYEASIDAEEKNNDSSPAKWIGLGFCLAIILGATISMGLNSGEVTNWAQNHTAEFISIVGGTAILMALGLSYLFTKKVKEEESEKNTRWYQDLALVATVGLMVTLILFHPDVQKFLHIQSPLVDFSSISSFPIIFGLGTLSGGLGYYGLFYRYAKDKEEVNFASLGYWPTQNDEIDENEMD